jgi:CRP-like cAMP-binding protein
MASIDMRTFAKGAGVTLAVPAGGTLFNEGDPADHLYIVQSGVIEMEIHGKVVDTCGPGEAVGFMAVIDGLPRTSTARIKEPAEVSVIDKRKFRFMVDEVPNFAQYIMEAMAHRIRGMRQAI